MLQGVSEVGGNSVNSVANSNLSRNHTPDYLNPSPPTSWVGIRYPDLTKLNEVLTAKHGDDQLLDDVARDLFLVRLVIGCQYVKKQRLF